MIHPLFNGNPAESFNMRLIHSAFYDILRPLFAHLRWVFKHLHILGWICEFIQCSGPQSLVYSYENGQHYVLKLNSGNNTHRGSWRQLASVSGGNVNRENITLDIMGFKGKTSWKNYAGDELWKFPSNHKQTWHDSRFVLLFYLYIKHAFSIFLILLI